MTRGFTLLELILTLSIIAILSSLVFYSGGRLREKTNVNATAQEVASLINKTQSKTQSGFEGSAYGLRILADRAVLFSGSSYSAGNITETYEVSPTISLSISPAVDLTFSRLTGALTSGVTTTVSITGATTTRQVIVSPNGTVVVQ